MWNWWIASERKYDINMMKFHTISNCLPTIIMDINCHHDTRSNNLTFIYSKSAIFTQITHSKSTRVEWIGTIWTWKPFHFHLGCISISFLLFRSLLHPLGRYKPRVIAMYKVRWTFGGWGDLWSWVHWHLHSILESQSYIWTSHDAPFEKFKQIQSWVSFWRGWGHHSNQMYDRLL